MNSGKLPKVRGMKDILPEQQNALSYIKKINRRRCRQFHFKRIATPVVEFAQLFERGVGGETDIVAKELYKFEDKGGRELALKPEGTAGVVRSYIENGMQVLQQPVKLFYIEPHFRYDRPQKGRYRQLYQIGFESIGSAAPASDAECINLVWKILQDIGLKDLTIKLNSIGCNSPKCRPKYIENLQDYYYSRRKHLCPDCVRRLEHNPLRLLDCKVEDCKILASKAPKSKDFLCVSCIDHYTKLKNYLQILAIPYVEDDSLVRGLDYYTKTVVEFFAGKEVNALGGGGRYDNLVEKLGGKETPAFGIALGADRLMELMAEQKIEIVNRFKVDVFLIQLGEEAKCHGFKIMNELHELGVKATANFTDSGLKNQLKYAEKLGTRYVIIIGDLEVKEQLAIVRDMDEGSQETVKAQDLIKYITGIIPEEQRKKTMVDKSRNADNY